MITTAAATATATTTTTTIKITSFPLLFKSTVMCSM
jgi:hypothetical protein